MHPKQGMIVLSDSGDCKILACSAKKLPVDVSKPSSGLLFPHHDLPISNDQQQIALHQQYVVYIEVRGHSFSAT